MPELMPNPKLDDPKTKLLAETNTHFHYQVPGEVSSAKATTIAMELHKKMPWMVGKTGFLETDDGLLLEVSKDLTHEQKSELFEELNKLDGFNLPMEENPLES